MTGKFGRAGAWLLTLLVMAAIVRPFLFVHSVLATVQRWFGINVKTGGDNQ